jgi:DNA polymerase III epsilon subunit-like protein
VDTTFECQIFLAGRCPELAQLDPYNLQLPRQPSSTLSLTNLLRTFGIEPERTCKMHNAGNDAFMALTALQLLIEPNTKIHELRPRSGTLNVRRNVVGLPMGMGMGMAASSRALSALLPPLRS